MEQKKNSSLLYIVIAVLLLGVLAYFFASSREVKYQWWPSMEHAETEPYDFKLLEELLKTSVDSFERYENKRIEEQLSTANAENSLYVFIGAGEPYYSAQDAEKLKAFLEAGGNALIVAIEPSDSLFYTLFESYHCFYSLATDYRHSSMSSKQVLAGFYADEYDDGENAELYPFAYKTGVKDTGEYYWTYIPDYNICSGDEPAVVEAGFYQLEGSISDMRYPYLFAMEVGEGRLYWHSNPIMLTNLYLSQKTNGTIGYNYLQRLLEPFSAQKIIWDYASTTPRPYEYPRSPQRYDKPPTPMEYVFSQTALRWAWLLLVAGAFSYALFGAKRRQQQIEVLPKNHNTSLGFVKTISRLYFQRQSHGLIFEKIMQIFHSHLRKRYGLNIKNWDNLAAQQIAQRSEIDYKIIEEILERYNSLSSQLAKPNVTMSPETLNNFYLLVQKFYDAEEARRKQPSA